MMKYHTQKPYQPYMHKKDPGNPKGWSIDRRSMAIVVTSAFLGAVAGKHIRPLLDGQSVQGQTNHPAHVKSGTSTLHEHHASPNPVVTIEELGPHLNRQELPSTPIHEIGPIPK